MYEYIAVVTKVHDGDTITVDVDLGWGIWAHDQSLRLNRINSPELADKSGAGKVAQKALVGILPLGSEVVVRTIKDKTEKYGRMLAEIYLADDKLRLTNINDNMVKNGFAKYWDGTGVRPV